MAVVVKSLYSTDFAEWAAQTAELLRERRFDEIDIENVAEEIRSLGESQFQGARSQPRRMLKHLIKIQPERDGASWRGSIINAQREALDAIESSPSLRRKLTENLQRTYSQAIEAACYETGRDAAGIPEECPFTLKQVLEGNPTLLRL